PVSSPFSLLAPRPPCSTLFPYTTLFRSSVDRVRLGRPRRLEVRPVPLPLSSLLDPLSNLGNLLRLERFIRFKRRHVVIVITRQRSEEQTSELQSLAYLVCRLLLEKKKSD